MRLRGLDVVGKARSFRRLAVEFALHGSNPSINTRHDTVYSGLYWNGDGGGDAADVRDLDLTMNTRVYTVNAIHFLTETDGFLLHVVLNSIGWKC